MGNYKKVAWIKMNKYRQWNRSLIYTHRFKVIEKELTWDLFIKCLNECFEFCFYYQNLTIDIAFHYENQKKIYELNISDGKEQKYLCFNSIDELVSYKEFNNKSLFDIWEELEN